MSGGQTIFCARCGAAGQRVESYCRSCGEWLADPSAALTPRGRLRRMSPDRKQSRMRVLELLSATAAFASGIITLAVLDGADRALLCVPAVLCLTVAMWQLVTFFIGRSLQKRQPETEAEGGPALPTARAGARPSLNPADTTDLVPPPSVTENTTALLDPSPARRGEKR